MWLAVLFFFFFNDTATTEIYTLSLHDALPILLDRQQAFAYTQEDLKFIMQPMAANGESLPIEPTDSSPLDRKSTRLNSSHANISYAVFCLKKKKRGNVPGRPVGIVPKSPSTYV